MTPELFREAGRLLYGEQWISDMAAALDVNPRHVRRLAAGETPVSSAIAGDVVSLLGQRKTALAAFIAQLR